MEEVMTFLDKYTSLRYDLGLWNKKWEIESFRKQIWLSYPVEVKKLENVILAQISP